MSLTESVKMEVGQKAPSFKLPDTVSGKNLSLNELKGEKATLILFICNHCPYVLHVNDELVRLADDYQPKGVSIIAISSNDAISYPQDGPDKMKIMAEETGYTFPYLYDESQEVAKAYDAVCTPDIYLFGKDLSLAYHGRLDGSRPGNQIPLTGKDLRKAMDLVLEGKPVPEPHYPSAGCNIKWKS